MIAVYLVAALAVAVAIASPQESRAHGICVTPTCIVTLIQMRIKLLRRLTLSTLPPKIAADLMRSMNTTVDPCDDFYEYACGKWIKNNPAPYWKSEWAVFYKMRDDVFYNILEILNQGHRRSDPEAVRKVKSIYIACMDTDTIDSRLGRPLMPVLRSMGGWPVLERNWDERRFNFTNVLVKLNDIGLQPLVKYGIWTGYKKVDLKTYFFQVDQPELNLKREYFLNSQYSSFMTLYTEFAQEMAVKLGSRARDVNQQMVDMVNFEKELAALTAPWSQRKNWDNVYRKLTVAQFGRDFTNFFSLETYINALLQTVNSRKVANQNTVMINWGLVKYWRGLEALLNRTPKKTIANYMIFSIVYNTVGYLSPTEYGGIIEKFVTPIWGRPNNNQRRDSICSWSTTKDYGWAVGRMFIDDYFTADAKITASSMIEDLRTVFKGMLSKVSWMDRTAQNAAVAKVIAIKKDVGYPEEIADDTRLNHLYRYLHAADNTYYENLLSTWQRDWRDSLLNYGKSVDRDALVQWLGAIPAAILQVPFYHKDYPKYLNYAGIGYIIGHELTHGFDNSGKEFDLHGNERQWWSKSVIAKYTKRAKCFVKQYNNYYVPEVKRYVNGSLTLNENLADNGGILESYKAYRRYVKRLGHEEDVLPGIGLDTSQLFYLNVAQVWCGKVLYDNAWDWDLKEVHSPMRYRIWGSMQNSPDFHKAFNCPKGSHMNPRKQCQMW